MSYQVLARAFRPQRFADLLGQDAVVQTLQNALATNTFGQAYLFSGLRGVGKTTAARLLAKAVNCERGPTPEPCGGCFCPEGFSCASNVCQNGTVAWVGYDLAEMRADGALDVHDRANWDLGHTLSEQAKAVRVLCGIVAQHQHVLSGK